MRGAESQKGRQLLGTFLKEPHEVLYELFLSSTLSFLAIKYLVRTKRLRRVYSRIQYFFSRVIFVSFIDTKFHSKSLIFI